MTVVIKCVGCKRTYALEMTMEQYTLLTGPPQERPLMQQLFPGMSADDRELLLSQTCGPCYDKLFTPTDEDE